MSGEKIDLDKFALDAARMVGLFGPTATYRGKAVEMLALVAAVRAASAALPHVSDDEKWSVLYDALSPFTDSAEVRSDG